MASPGDTGSGRGYWASRLGFILAAAGSSIGLGNLWKFPYMAGQNGGGAFVLCYLAFVAGIGFPIMVAEFALGRRSQRDVVGAFAVTCQPASPWRYAGWIPVTAAFVLFSFYAVVAGWVLAYVPKAAVGAFAGLDASRIGELFTSLVAQPGQVLTWQLLFVAATAAVVTSGIHGGIERCSRLLMPLLFVLLLLLVGYGLWRPEAATALTFLFKPDFSQLTAAALLEALGQAFFSLSLGAGVMVTYGSYLGPQERLLPLSLRITLLDTTVALCAGIAIFPLVFASGQSVAMGPGLVFKTLPLAFAQLPGGAVLGGVFFLLLAFAALSSSISMLEVAVSYLVDEKNWRRPQATWSLALAAFGLGIPSALSFNLWQQLTLGGRTFFQWGDFLVSSVLLPLGGLLVALYVGWRRLATPMELGASPSLYTLWLWLLRLVVPVAMLLILAHKLGWG